MRKTIIFCAFALLMLSFVVIQTREEVMKEQMDLFGEFMTLLDKNYVDTLNLPDLMNKTMNKSLGELDPYSHYYDIEETKKHDEAWKGILYAGMGSTVKLGDSGVVVSEPTDSLPAMRIGLRTGDIILEINGRNVQHLTLDSVVHLLKGNEGDSVSLTLRRPYAGVLHKKFARKKIINKAIPLYFLDKDSTGYIAFAHTLEGSAADLKKTFTGLKAKGMKRLILDMRGNNGGLVDECVSALSAFFPGGTLVCSLRLKDSTGNYSYRTSAPFIDTVMPVILLTDRHTISSGEIFSGCMKDNKRATLIGDRTYGKGFVQSTRYFKNRQSLYCTVARYYTPSGSFIGAKGVDPDISFTKTDSVPPDLQAVINSGLITDYSVKYRNTKKNDVADFKDLSYNDFVAFYQAHVSSVQLPEEKSISQFGNYASAKTLKTEIKARKLQLPLIYKKEILVELKKELYKRYYLYNDSGRLAFDHSIMFNYLAEKGFISKN